MKTRVNIEYLRFNLKSQRLEKLITQERSLIKVDSMTSVLCVDGYLTFLLPYGITVRMKDKRKK